MGSVEAATSRRARGTPHSGQTSPAVPRKLYPQPGHDISRFARYARASSVSVMGGESIRKPCAVVGPINPRLGLHTIPGGVRMLAPEPSSADVGLVGLAVMGQNLALNIADHGFQIAVYNR